jgi:hypothetical protein
VTTISFLKRPGVESSLPEDIVWDIGENVSNPCFLDFLQAIREVCIVPANVPGTSSPTTHVPHLQSEVVHHTALK